MKLLVAARTLLGMRGRQNDVWENPNIGEIVIPPFTAQLPLGAYADDEDGMARSFFALSSGARTSVAQVREVPISDAALRDQLAKFVLDVVYRGQTLCETFNVRKVVDRHCDGMCDNLRRFSIGQIVEIRDNRIAVRLLQTTLAQR